MRLRAQRRRRDGEPAEILRVLGTTGPLNIGNLGWRRLEELLSTTPLWQRHRHRYQDRWVWMTAYRPTPRGVERLPRPDRASDVRCLINTPDVVEVWLRHGIEEAAKYTAEKHARDLMESNLYKAVNVVKEGDGYAVYALVPAAVQFWEDVEAGKFRVAGRKVSPHQILGVPPSHGFLNVAVSAFSKAFQQVGGSWAGEEPIVPERTETYRPGLVVKLMSDYDPKLDRYHNAWAVVTRVIDPWHLEVWPADDALALKPMVVRDVDVKGWIGDQHKDYAGLGAKRWKEEVLPLIERALSGKVPLSPHLLRERIEWLQREWPKIFGGLDYGGLAKEHRRARREAELIEANKDKYHPEDYELLKRYYGLLLRILERMIAAKLKDHPKYWRKAERVLAKLKGEGAT